MPKTLLSLLVLTLLSRSSGLSPIQPPAVEDGGAVAVIISRRHAIATMLVTPVLGAAQPALPLQEKNEALCGTGFFTNIAQYKCTDIGDISDDGKATPLTSAQEGAMESLLGKMGVSTMEEDSSSSDRAEKKTKKPALETVKK